MKARDCIGEAQNDLTHGIFILKQSNITQIEHPEQAHGGFVDVLQFFVRAFQSRRVTTTVATEDGAAPCGVK